MRDLRNQIKWILSLTVLFVVITFAAQNSALVEIRFLTWTFEIRRVAIIAASLIVGGLIGWMFGAASRRKKTKF